MRSSLHALADSDEPDLGALIYASRRLPGQVFRAPRIVLGQEAVQFARATFGQITAVRAEYPERQIRLGIRFQF